MSHIFLAMTLARAAVVAVALATLAFAAPSRADEPSPIPLVIQDHRFTPAEIRVPAGKAAVLEIDNRDASAEEFESPSLKVEKVIAAGRKGIVRLRPLAPGHYPFMGEYHSDTARGVVIAE